MQLMVGEFSKVTGIGCIFLPSRGKSLSNNSLSGFGRIGGCSEGFSDVVPGLATAETLFFRASMILSATKTTNANAAITTAAAIQTSKGDLLSIAAQRKVIPPPLGTRAQSHFLQSKMKDTMKSVRVVQSSQEVSRLQSMNLPSLGTVSQERLNQNVWI